MCSGRQRRPGTISNYSASFNSHPIAMAVFRFLNYKPLGCLLFITILSSTASLVQGFGIAQLFPGQQKSIPVSETKQKLLDSFENTHSFNDATEDRTALVAAMTAENPTPRPGSSQSFAPLAAGTWRIVYAPHISTMGKLFSGKFDPVYYILRQDGTMVSHARYEFPFIGSGWLSVSGTYSSQDEDQVCRVDFDEAWIKLQDETENTSTEFLPYSELEDVPESMVKTVINQVGKFLFLEQFSKFPVSFLDNDTIVFDFELLGTRICARKVNDKV